MDYQDVQNKQNIYYKQETFKSKCLKLWVLAFIIITCIYGCCIMFYGFSFDTFSNENKNYLRTITPAYPPPLFNFMDIPRFEDE